jgi:hypothetical protein
MKYEFTGETKVVLGVTLRRIRALVSFGAVVKGQIGGWIAAAPAGPGRYVVTAVWSAKRQRREVSAGSSAEAVQIVMKEWLA